MPPRYKNLIWGGICFVAILAILYLVFPTPPAHPSLAIRLKALPKLEPEPSVFYSSDTNGGNLQVTQRCYRAEVTFKNVGSGSIILPSRGLYSLEIQTVGSSHWKGVNQVGFERGAILKAGFSRDFAIRVPADAERWRVSTTYRHWLLPKQFVNYILRDILRTDLGFGNSAEKDIISEVWELDTSF